MSEPTLIRGNVFADHRGNLRYNNAFDASLIKRVYIIENKDTEMVRAWQGHRIEQKWMAPVSGKFRISLVKIEDWENPDPYSEVQEFILTAEQLNVVHIPAGYANCIQALEKHSKLLVMADHILGEVDDEFRFDASHFLTRSPTL